MCAMYCTLGASFITNRTFLCLAVFLISRCWLLVTSILFSPCLLLLRPLSRSLVIFAKLTSQLFCPLSDVKMYEKYSLSNHIVIISNFLLSNISSPRLVSFVSEKCWDSGRHNPDIWLCNNKTGQRLRRQRKNVIFNSQELGLCMYVGSE